MSGLPAEVGENIRKVRMIKPDIRLVKSKDLFINSREIVIEHNDDFYRLSITKAGKLILNK